MNPFRYVRDPVCLIACAGYAFNRWLMPESWKGVFFHGYFSDLLLIPAALPVMLWLQRRLGLRTTDTRPDWREILLHLTAWSIAAEMIAPHYFTRATSDLWDIAAYAGGAVLSGFIWQSA